MLAWDDELARLKTKGPRDPDKPVWSGGAR